jgi:hypothetical protein
MNPIVRHSHPALAAVLLLSALLAGCVQGAGPVTSEIREIRPFSSIEVGAGIHLEVQIGAPDRLEVHAQSNILPAIATDVSGSMLTIDAREDFMASEPVTVTVVMPALDAISMNGGAQARIAGIDAAALELTVKGGSQLAIVGNADVVALTVDGGSAADLAGLAAGRISVAFAGGATATVAAADEVTGNATGGSRLSVLGDPHVSVEVSGGAEVVSR